MAQLFLTAQNIKDLTTYYEWAKKVSKGQQESLRDSISKIDSHYYSDYEEVKKSITAAEGNFAELANVPLPNLYVAVETGVSDLAATFLSGTPIFSVLPSAKYREASEMMNTLIDNQSIHGGWANQLIECFRDAEKYNLMAVEVDWKKEQGKTLDYSQSNNTLSPNLKETYWEGNRLKKLDLYNTFWDPNTPIEDITSKGDFIGYSEKLTKTQVHTFFASEPEILDKTKESILVGSDKHTVNISPASVDRVEPNNQDGKVSDWEVELFQTGKEKERAKTIKASYVKTTLYARFRPTDVGSLKIFPQRDTVQTWKLIFINDILCLATPLNFLHTYFPIVIATANAALSTSKGKSNAEFFLPYQIVGTVFLNSALASRRRVVNDRAIYDPSYFFSKDINSKNPSAKIPLRPNGWGKPEALAGYRSLPFQDITSDSLLSTVGLLDSLGMKALGQNMARQGQFVKGNKSVPEFQNIFAAGSQRQFLKNTKIESVFFTPIKFIIKSNILQRQSAEDLLSRETLESIQIDPIALRKAVLQFKVIDSSEDPSKTINDEALAVAFQTLTTLPQLGQEYNISGIFSHLLSLRGVKISDFKKSPEEIEYLRAVQVWQQTVLQLSEQGAKTYPPQPQWSEYAPVPAN